LKKLLFQLRLKKKVKIKMKKQDLPESVETNIIVPIEQNKKVKIKKLTTILPEDNIKLRLRKYINTKKS